MNFNNQNGMAVVEALTVAIVVGSLVTLLLAGMYLTFAKVWIQHSSYKGLICAVQGQPSSICKSIVKEKLHSGLPIGRVNSLSLRPSGSGWKIYIKWTMMAGRNLQYSKSLRYEK